MAVNHRFVLLHRVLFANKTAVWREYEVRRHWDKGGPTSVIDGRDDADGAVWLVVPNHPNYALMRHLEVALDTLLDGLLETCRMPFLRSSRLQISDDSAMPHHLGPPSIAHDPILHHPIRLVESDHEPLRVDTEQSASLRTKVIDEMPVPPLRSLVARTEH